MVALVGPIVVPVASRGKIHIANGRALFDHRSNEKSWAKHIFIGDVRDAWIIRKIHEQRAHKWRPGVIGVVAERIDIGHQLITQLQILLENWLGLFPVRPDLVPLAASVRAHDRKKCSVLKPASKQFGIVVVSADVFARVGRIEQGRIFGVMFARQVLPAADIVRPIRDAGSREVQTGRNLPLVGIPRGRNIRRPHHGAVSL